MKPVQIYKCKDLKEAYYTDKGLQFNLPMRILAVGKSQYSGKSSFLLNILEQNDDRLYKKNFDGDDIYIFSGSLTTDNKVKTIISQHDIPEENLHECYDEDMMEAIFDLTKENYEEAISNKESPKNVLVLLDDCSFDGSLKSKNNGMLNKIFCNGRHINMNIIATSQKYSQLHTCMRENATGLVLWSCTDKQLDLISDEHNTLGDKKVFKSMFREVTSEPYSALIINYSNPKESRYMNINFESIGSCGKVKGKGCPCE